MKLRRTAQGVVWLGRIDQRFGETPLVLDGQADDLRLLDRAVRGFLRGGDDEIADAAALYFGGAFDNGQRVGRDTRLDASGTI